MYLKTYTEYLYEKDSEDLKKVKKEEKKDDKLAKKVEKEIKQEVINAMYNSQIPKDQILIKLSKELFDSLTAAIQFKYKLEDKITAMKNDGASDNDITKATEMGADQMAELQLRGDSIEIQMIALAADNAKLVYKATELAAQAKQLAGKANKEFFERREQNKIKDIKARKIAADKEKAEKEAEKAKEETKK